MDIVKKEQVLEKEYIENYTKINYWVLKLFGFTRFDVQNGKIVTLTLNTLVYRAVLLLVSDLALFYLLYTSVVAKNYLKLPDGMCLIHFGSFANMLLINLTFINRQSGSMIIKQGFKIDLHLGLDDTKFMRVAEMKTFYFLSTFMAVYNVLNGIFLYKLYDVSMTIHIIGSLYFFWLSSCYDDYSFYLLYSMCMGLRAHYFNVALAKLGNMKLQYLTNSSLLTSFLWKKKYDNLVTFQYRTSVDDYITTYQLLFELKRYLDDSYRFVLGLGVWTVVTGTFVATQAFIERIKDPNALGHQQTYLIICWALLCWNILFVISLFFSMLQQEIEQTKLICVCIQLKPGNPPHLYNLTKKLLRMLERRETRTSVYNIFYFDTSFLLRMAASTAVYITVQFQLAFPKLLTNAPYNSTIDYNNYTQGTLI